MRAQRLRQSGLGEGILKKILQDISDMRIEATTLWEPFKLSANMYCTVPIWIPAGLSGNEKTSWIPCALRQTLSNAIDREIYHPKGKTFATLFSLS